MQEGTLGHKIAGWFSAAWSVVVAATVVYLLLVSLVAVAGRDARATCLPAQATDDGSADDGSADDGSADDGSADAAAAQGVSATLTALPGATVPATSTAEATGNAEQAAATDPAIPPLVASAWPTQFVISGVYGEAPTRTVRLQGALTGTTHFFPGDLSEVGGTGSLSAGLIQLTIHPAATPVPGLPTSATVCVELAGADAGRYTGSALLISGSDPTAQAAMAFDVSVKDRMAWPLIMLLAGLIVCAALNYYTSHLAPFDAVVASVDDLTNAVRSEPESTKSAFADFRVTVEYYMARAQAAVRQKDEGSAARLSKLGWTTWDLWNTERAGWIAAGERRATLTRRLREEDPFKGQAVLYLQDLEEALRTGLPERITTTVIAPATDDAKAPAYLTEIIRLEGLAEKFREMAAELDRVAGIIGGMPTGTPAEQALKQSRQQALDVMEAKMHNLRPASTSADADKLADLMDEIGGILDGGAEPSGDLESTAFGSQAQDSQPPTSSIWADRDSGPQVEAEARKVRASRQRLWLLPIVTFALAVVLVGGFGFEETYIKNPTFGANPWSDYLAVFVWGFGAQASAASVASLLSKWRVPGFTVESE